MRTKQEILDEIKRTAKENGGNPLGKGRFESETGIKPYDWGKFWARFGDAQQEAGFAPNQLQSAYTDDFLIQKIIGIIRKLGKFPTCGEIEIERANDQELPANKTFGRLGSKEQFVKKVLAYCENKTDYDDVTQICDSILKKSGEYQSSNDASGIPKIGAVYLYKSGTHYKIGKSYDTVRRGNELRIQLPEDLNLIHEIKTDDPSGVKLYWHKRFESKRMNGEWFDLNSPEVKAFRCWRHIH